jgi:transcriptional regulatory protein GAL4
LETRLEKAEQLLKSQYSPQQLADYLDGKSAIPPQGLPTGPGSGASATPSAHALHMTAETPSKVLPEPDLASYPTLNSLPAFDIIQHGCNDSLAAASASQPSPDDSFNLDPATADDFEWNEQESSWAMGPGGGSGFPQTITDGMASLAVGERRGYLGAVSGAALLRQVLSSDRDGQGLQTGTPWQQYDSLFQQRLDQSQWFQTRSMLTRVGIENLFDAFFTFYHPTFPIIHEPTFRAQYANILPRHDNAKWVTLANIVAALGSFAGSLSADATDISIFQEAQKSLFADNLEAGNLTLVQSFALSATYLQKRNKPNTGYNYSGIAVRLAIGLGLHKDYQEGHISPLQVEIRRRVWWTLCVLDVGAVISYGRPLNWPRAGVETALPRNLHEEVSTESPSCLSAYTDRYLTGYCI